MRALLILLTLLALSGTPFCRAQDLALRNAKIYESPSRPPLEHGTVLGRGENIAWVGSTTDARLPREARVSCAGMSHKQILASLTTTPARRFGYSEHAGKVAKGYDADLVVLRDDPAKDATAFARIRCTIRKGMVIYESPTR
jgi:hypothetical protein